MSGNGFNPYSDAVARELHDANDQLRDVNRQLWKANQPPEVRAALQARRADEARAMRWGLRAVLGLGAAWFVLSRLFGMAGARVFGGLVSLLIDALGVLMVAGVLVWAGGGIWRGLRALTGPGEERR